VSAQRAGAGRNGVDALVDSLLYEGYALYPYTPGATKNATPTPHGIVYPPAYAERHPTAPALLRVEVVLEHGPEARVAGSVRFLQASGERHQGVEHSLQLPAAPVARLAAEPPPPAELELAGGAGAPVLRGRVRIRAEALGEGLARVKLCVHNTTELAGGGEAERPEALRASLLSTHVVLRAEDGRFVSPLDTDGLHGEAVAGCENVNTWPVLAAADDDVVLGAAMFLPDHPRLAPESLGNLFDNTEIEEALLLHVQTLSEEERRQIAAQDPKVREMIERAERATPEQMLGLHGRLEPGHPQLGEVEATVGERTIRRGARVVLRPRQGAGDPYDTILAGRAATVERIYVDYEDGVHLGVTVDEDPGQELMRESGRYLFFRPDEVELR
jgi:hypothetical protein